MFKIFIIFLNIFLSSCCLFVGKGFVYKWSEDKSDFKHYLKHKNKQSSLSFKLTTDKKEYFNGEIKILYLKISNESATDTILIKYPSFYKLNLYDSTGKVKKCMWVSPDVHNQSLIVDKCGRRVINVNPPQNKLLPGDSITYTNSNFLNYFCNKRCDQELKWNSDKLSKLDLSRKAGILPFCLNEGNYRIELNYEHYCFDEDDKPNLEDIKIEGSNFRILNFNDNTKKDYIEFLKFCTTFLFEKRSMKYEDFIINNPYNLYNKNLRVQLNRK